MTLPAVFTLAEALDDSFERAQIQPGGITPEHIISARRSVRLMLDSWNNDGVLFWKVAAGQTVTLSQGDNVFTVPAGTIDLLQVSIFRNTCYTPVTLISESDWFAIPDKDAVPQVQGMPRMCWVQRLQNQVIAHIYPASENSTDVVTFDAMLQFNDSSQLSGQPDVPPRWNECFVSGLTSFICEKFNRPLFAEKRMKYGGPGYTPPRNQPMTDYQIAKMGDRDRSDTILVYSRRRRWLR